MIIKDRVQWNVSLRREASLRQHDLWKSEITFDELIITCGISSVFHFPVVALKTENISGKNLRTHTRETEECDGA